MLSVCVDETDARIAQDVAARHAPGLPVYVASDAAVVRKRFHVQRVPEALLVDRNGRMLGRFNGARQWTGSKPRGCYPPYSLLGFLSDRRRMKVSDEPASRAKQGVVDASGW